MKKATRHTTTATTTTTTTTTTATTIQPKLDKKYLVVLLKCHIFAEACYIFFFAMSMSQLGLGEIVEI